MQLMVEGDKWEIVAPSQLGYGEEGMEGMVPPGEALVYILELVKIEGDNAGPRPWDSHAKLLSAKDQRRRTNGGPLRPSSAPMRPERRSGSSNEPWIGWSPDPGKRVLPVMAAENFDGRISADGARRAPPGRFPTRAQRVFGGIDGKVTSYSRVMTGGSSLAQAGPTHDDQPVFSWSEWGDQHAVHLGQPDRFDFAWIEVEFDDAA